MNLHFSVLPSWRGAAPVQRALIAGDEVVGATTFALEEGLDTGPIYGVMTEAVRPADTAGDLLARIAEAGAGLLVQTLDGIEAGTLRPVPQPAEGVSLAPKLTSEDARVDWSASARAVDRLVRGCTPAPGAWTTFRGERLKLGPVRPVDAQPDGAPAGLAVGRDRGQPALGPGRHRGRSGRWRGRARRRPAARPAADAGGGLGARRAGRRGGPAGRMSERPRGPRGPRPRSAQAPSNRARRTDPARRAAYDVLRAVEDRDAYANLVLPGLLRSRGLTGRDAAFATELTYGTLRWQGTYDAVLDACLDKPLQGDPGLRDALRLGVHQLLGMRVQTHAAVSETVGLVREAIGVGPSGLANAVLRRVGERDLAAWVAQLAPPAEQDLVGPPGRGPEPPGLGGPGDAGRPGRPRQRPAGRPRPAGPRAGRAAGGRQRAAGGDARRAAGAEHAGRAADRSRGPARAMVAVRRRGRGGSRRPGCGARRAGRRPGRGQPARGHWRSRRRRSRAGTSAGSTCAPGRAARRPSSARWPASAAAHLVANEISTHRAQLVGQAVAALGASVEVREADGREIGRLEPAAYDRVLVDAPCTGLGALRRRPESRWRRQPGDVGALGRLQRDLLGSAVDATRPGGLVAYVTCSPHVGETLLVVQDLLRRRPDVEALDARPVLAGLVAGGRDRLIGTLGDGPSAQLWPHRHGTDAMFLALLRRTSPTG